MSLDTQTNETQGQTELTAVTLADGTELVGMVAKVNGVHASTSLDRQGARNWRTVHFDPIRIGGESVYLQLCGEGPDFGYSDVNPNDEFVLTLVPRK